MMRDQMNRKKNKWITR